MASQEDRPMINQFLAALVIGAATAAPVPAAPSPTMLRPIACQTEDDLFELLNAADRRDRKEAARLTKGACTPLAGVHYELVGDDNGVSTIRLFPRQGDWASSRLAYTLDEMVTGD
jgi:hypothetical protein